MELVDELQGARRRRYPPCAVEDGTTFARSASRFKPRFAPLAPAPVTNVQMAFRGVQDLLLGTFRSDYGRVD